VYEYFGLMPEMQKILENPKMSFNGQSNELFALQPFLSKFQNFEIFV
jgi:hypothetical protein